MTQKVYSAIEAAALSGLTIDTVRLHLRTGKLPSKRIGQTYVIYEGDLQRWLAVPHKPGRPWPKKKGAAS